ncbi:MAG: hypothetical protein ACI90G_001744, partial [Urechidicola sp.]
VKLSWVVTQKLRQRLIDLLRQILQSVCVRIAGPAL